MFSKELEQSIANLFDQAQDQNLEYLTIEHLLLMLLSDFEVRQALETNDVNIATLRENLEEHVRDNTPSKVDAKKPVQPTLGFQRVLQRAVFHVQSSGKGVVKPINLLVAIFSEKEMKTDYDIFEYSWLAEGLELRLPEIAQKIGNYSFIKE